MLLFENISNKALIKMHNSGMLKIQDAPLNINEAVIEKIAKIRIVTAFKEIFSILKNFLASKTNKEVTAKLIRDMKINP